MFALLAYKVYNIDMANEQQMREIIKRKQTGSLRKLARDKKVSASYLSDVLAGNRGVSDGLARKFGYERIEVVDVSFRRVFQGKPKNAMGDSTRTRRAKSLAINRSAERAMKSAANPQST